MKKAGYCKNLFFVAALWNLVAAFFLIINVLKDVFKYVDDLNGFYFLNSFSISRTVNSTPFTF